jgi:hypothetical protein
MPAQTPAQVKKYLLSSPTHAGALKLLQSPGASDPAPHNDTGTAQSKQQALWAKILADNNVGASWPTALELLGLFTENDNVSGDWHSDLFPPGRQKLIHSVGAAALFSWRPSSVRHGYTGLFATGAQYGLLRAASAIEPSTSWWTGEKSMAPGFSLKFFRDDVESANTVALWSLSTTPSFNFFEHDGFMNHVGAANLSVVEQVSVCARARVILRP